MVWRQKEESSRLEVFSFGGGGGEDGGRSEPGSNVVLLHIGLRSQDRRFKCPGLVSDSGAL